MSNTDRDSMLERWAIGMEKLEQYYEGKYGPPATPAQLPAITTYDGMLEAIADGMERAKRNINKKSPTYHSDSVAYVKTVPAGNVHYASLEQIGGKTLVFNQLADFGTVVWESGTKGVAFTQGTPIVAGHKYYFTTTITSETNVDVRIYTRANDTNKIEARSYRNTPATVFTATNNAVSDGTNSSSINGNVWLYLNVSSGDSAKDIRLTDLTFLFGAGNEPSTAAEFEAIFPNYVADSVTYDLGSLLSAGVTSVVSKDSTDTEIATYTIPAEVQALTGYGLSVGNVYNYIDFDNKKFVQNVGAADIGSLTLGYGPSVGWNATLPNVKDPADDDAVFNGISDNYTAVSRNTQATAFAGGTDAGMVSVAGGKVYVGTGSISIVPSGTLIYELDEPVETDISAYLTDDGLIEVEVGGTLEFPNQNGNDYRIPVPSSETFIVGEP